MIYFLPYYAVRFLEVTRMRREYARQRAIVLTYDDGPGKRLTRSLLELLAGYDAKATFFLLGRRVVEDVETVDLVRDAGHELGVHSFDHLNARKTSGSRAVDDINAGYEAVSRWVPADGPFRPPHGKLSYATWRALRKRGARICWWTVDSGDTWPELPRPQRTADEVVRRGGGVVLLHDFDRSPDREDYVLQTTQALLKAAAEHHLNVITLSCLYAQGVREY